MEKYICYLLNKIKQITKKITLILNSKLILFVLMASCEHWYERPLCK